MGVDDRKELEGFVCKGCGVEYRYSGEMPIIKCLCGCSEFKVKRKENIN